MAKKDFGNLEARLAPVTESKPALRPPVALAVVPPAPEAAPAPARKAARAASKPAPAAQDEGVVQQTFNLRPSLRKALHRLAADAELTVGGFILTALRAKGLAVSDSDIADGRKRR